MPLLALLAKEPAHGYELKMLLEQIFGEAYPSPNIGQIYVTLQRLERDGLVRQPGRGPADPAEQARLRADRRPAGRRWPTGSTSRARGRGSATTSS